MQQLFRLLIFKNKPYMFRATNSPILRSTFWLYIQLLVQCTDTAADRCHSATVTPVGSSVGALCQNLYTQSKYAPDAGRICRSKHVGLILKRLLNEKVVASCWLLTSLYKWSTVTQTSSSRLELEKHPCNDFSGCFLTVWRHSLFP